MALSVKTLKNTDSIIGCKDEKETFKVHQNEYIISNIIDS